MPRLTARDLMAAEVVTVPPDTPVVAVARLLADRGISAVPVVDGNGTVLGIVTEADLIRRLAGEADKARSWLGSLFSSDVSDAERYARTHGVTARDIMTTSVVAVQPDIPAANVAQMMEEKAIRRVLVTEAGRLRGVVSRADLLRALVAPVREAGELSDERIRRAVVEAMRKQPWAHTFLTMFDVKQGVVEFYGFRRSDAVQRGLRVLALNVPGVKDVVDSTQALPAQFYAGL